MVAAQTGGVFARVRNVWLKLTSSLWFVPGLMAAGSMVLAAVVQTFDARTDLDPKDVPLLFRGTAEGAGSALAAVAGSMIGVTGVVFSITVVALSLASSQLGPRLLRSFMRDTTNQVVLGTFIATFLFCLIGLQAVNRDIGDAGVPRLTVTVGFGLAILSLGVLIYFIHHITMSMQADTVIANVAHELHEATERMFPSRLARPSDRPAPVPDPEGEPAAVPAPRCGYLQAIDEDRLLSLANEHDLVVRLRYRPGHFVRDGSAAAYVWPAERVTDEVEEALAKTFILGARRTEEQDVEFLVDQLVETAVRALSPGTNDPFTAIACIDHLGDAMTRLAGREFPVAARENEEGKLRVIARPVRFEGLMDAAFDQVRQAAKPSVSVTMRVLEALASVSHAMEEDDPRRAIVIDHAHRVHRTSLAAKHEDSDRDDIEERFHRVLEGVPPPAAGRRHAKSEARPAA